MSEGAIWRDIQKEAAARAVRAATVVVELMDEKQALSLYATIGMEFFMKAAAMHSAASGRPGPNNRSELVASAANYMRAMADLMEEAEKRS
jgi:hypothetical protein